VVGSFVPYPQWRKSDVQGRKVLCYTQLPSHLFWCFGLSNVKKLFFKLLQEHALADYRSVFAFEYNINSGVRLAFFLAYTFAEMIAFFKSIFLLLFLDFFCFAKLVGLFTLTPSGLVGEVIYFRAVCDSDVFPMLQGVSELFSGKLVFEYFADTISQPPVTPIPNNPSANYKFFHSPPRTSKTCRAASRNALTMRFTHCRETPTLSEISACV
jgi:hypothetical protein